MNASGYVPDLPQLLRDGLLNESGSYDPEGLHNVIWAELGQTPVPFSRDRPLQVVSYRAGASISSFIEPRAPGESLPDAYLFLAAARFVLVPLETTYEATFAALPAHLREEAGGS